MTHTRAPNSYWNAGADCRTAKKAGRKVRQAKRGHGHIPAAHPTKKVTRGRMRAAGTLPADHRKRSLKELIARASNVT